MALTPESLHERQMSSRVVNQGSLLNRAAYTTVADFQPFLNLLTIFIDGKSLLNIRGLCASVTGSPGNVDKYSQSPNSVIRHVSSIVSQNRPPEVVTCHLISQQSSSRVARSKYN
jgi:hypothetical protein